MCRVCRRGIDSGVTYGALTERGVMVPLRVSSATCGTKLWRDTDEELSVTATVRLGSICDAQFGGNFSATPRR